MSNKNQCEACGRSLKTGSVVRFGSVDESYRTLCTPCYNDTVAEMMGVDFDNAEFEPVTLKDADGVDHEFHFTMRFMGNVVVLSAHEMRNGERSGYKFEVVSEELEGDSLELLGKLLEKTRRGLARRHLERDENGVLGINRGDTVRATIECGDVNADFYERKPMLIIDGNEVTWDELGRMLNCYEGFQLKLEIYESHEER